MRFIFSVILLVLESMSHEAAALRTGKYSFSACDLNINYATFNDTKPGLSRKARACQSQLRITSLYLCIDEYCTEEGRDEWLTEQNGECERIAGVALPDYHGIVNEWTEEKRRGLKRFEADEAFGFPVLGEVVIPEGSFFERAFATLDAAFFEYEIHRVYGWCMSYFWILVVSVGIATRLISLIWNLKHQEWQPVPGSESEPANYRVFSLPWTLIKRHLLIPATFNTRCSRPYWWCTVPPRMQSLTIAAFICINIILCCVSYRTLSGNLYWPEVSAQLWRYVSDRTGIISLANFPLIWLFGQRNDVLIWVTGWGFGTYNAFHRWVARVSTAQAVVHSVGYTVMICQSGGWNSLKKYLGKHYFWNGELATIFMCFLLLFSVYGLRRSHYEIFLVTHIVFSIIVLWTMYYHVEIFVTGEWNIFIWPCLLFWIVDRVLRVVRILAFNWRFWNTRAITTYDPSSNLVKMEISCESSFLKPKPGTYYYIHVLSNPLYAHQNHPFTLAYVTSPKDGSHLDQSNSSSPFWTRPLPRRTNSSESTESTESDALLSSAASSKPSLTFLIRPYSGFTSRLKSYCISKSNSTRLRVLVEGPYGNTEPLQNYPNVLFVVGGTGIAVPLSHLSHLLGEDSRATNIKIVWAVREHAFLISILDEFKELLEDERVNLEVHVTQDEESKDDISGEDINDLKIVIGRPDVFTAVEEMAQEAGKQSLAIMACGPAQMADQARKASVEMLGNGYRGVDYFEESFKW